MAYARDASLALRPRTADALGVDTRAICIAPLIWFAGHQATFPKCLPSNRYKNWALQNRQGQYWPIPRAIFSVLFTHARFRIIHDAQSRARLVWTWVPTQAANAYVIGIVGSQLCGRMAGKGIGLPLTNLLSLALLAPAIWGLYQAQNAINAACGDPAGQHNQQITGANIGWLVLAGLLWALTLLGLVLPSSPERGASRQPDELGDEYRRQHVNRGR